MVGGRRLYRVLWFLGIVKRRTYRRGVWLARRTEGRMPPDAVRERWRGMNQLLYFKLIKSVTSLTCRCYSHTYANLPFTFIAGSTSTPLSKGVPPCTFSSYVL